jgi:RecB family exonuclease
MLGIPAEDLSRTIKEPDLRRWWHNYSRTSFVISPSRYPEIVLSAPMCGYRLMAKYDLVVADPGLWAAILDWKTSRKLPKRKHLAERLQTKVYPYLLVRAGAHLNDGQPLAPEQVEMIYWFADYPDDPAQFAYDAAQYEADEAYLTALIEEIAGLGDEDFPLTTHDRRCKFCPYRSLCQRGVRAGSLDEMEDEADAGDAFDFDIDFEQIAEIAY